jgi:hypothetical protein
MSVKAPPLINSTETSKTPPSNPFSKSKFWVNLNCPHDATKIERFVTSRYLSLLTPGALTQTAFGAESDGGEGIPEPEVCQWTPSGSIALVAVQFAGNAGGVKLSKFTLKVVTGGLPQDSGVAVGVAVGVFVGVNVGDAVAVGVAVGVPKKWHSVMLTLSIRHPWPVPPVSVAERQRRWPLTISVGRFTMVEI